MKRDDHRIWSNADLDLDDWREDLLDFSYDCLVLRKGKQMSINLVFKIAAVGILVSVLSQILKQSGREEHAFLTGMAGLVLVLFWLVPYISQLFETVKNLFAL